jgi:flagellar hook-length control protein FliK
VAALALETTSTPLETTADHTDGDTDDYSPESWLELLALAVSGITGSQAQHSGDSSSDSASQSSPGGTPSVKGAAGDDSVGALVAAFMLPGSDAGRDASRPDSVLLKDVVPSSNVTASVANVQMLAADTAAAQIGADSDRDAFDALQSAGSPSHGARPSAAHSTLALQQPVGTPAWQQELATRVTWLVRGADQTATLTLNPADLGPVEVRIAVREGEATVAFTATHADTRAALDAALPRLRDMFAAQGLLLTDGSVSAPYSGASGDAANDQSRRAQADLRRAIRGDDNQEVVATTRVTQQSLLDLYA